ncbi:MAG: cupin domain-containing protein [Chloroflexi bacterium]|nr:cupin domain-containing protein [Chloroflexota bacterium]
MVERISERKREAEPEETMYDRLMRMKNEVVRKRVAGKVVIKGKDRPWEQSRQALSKHLCSQPEWDTLAAPGWNIFIQKIKKHSGRHTHQGGLGLFVLEGKGYTVVDGVRYDWQKGDLIILPVKPGGCEHQHFNEDPEKPAVWMAWRYWPFGEVVDMHKTQQTEHPDWAGAKPGEKPAWETMKPAP